MNPYPETPDNWIERREEYAPPEGAIWCSDCGAWIEEPCEHLADEREADYNRSQFGRVGQ